MAELGFDLQHSIFANQAVGAASFASIANEADALWLSVGCEGIPVARFGLHFLAPLHVPVRVMVTGLARQTLSHELIKVRSARERRRALGFPLGEDGGEFRSGGDAEPAGKPLWGALLTVEYFNGHGVCAPPAPGRTCNSPLGFDRATGPLPNAGTLPHWPQPLSAGPSGSRLVPHSGCHVLIHLGRRRPARRYAGSGARLRYSACHS